MPLKPSAVPFARKGVVAMLVVMGSSISIMIVSVCLSDTMATVVV
jgi:hypothetical protein